MLIVRADADAVVVAIVIIVDVARGRNGYSCVYSFGQFRRFAGTHLELLVR